MNERVSIRTVKELYNAFKLVLKNDKPLDIISALLDNMKLIFGCQKVTIFPLDYTLGQMTTKNLPKDKVKMLFTVTFQDESDNAPHPIAALAKNSEELC